MLSPKTPEQRSWWCVHYWPLSAGAAGDAARDFLNDVSKQADAVKDSVSKQADTVKQSATAAVEDLKSQVSLHRESARLSLAHTSKTILVIALVGFRGYLRLQGHMRLHVFSVQLDGVTACLPTSLLPACLTIQTLKLANSAVSNIDSLVADVSSNAAAVKRDAGSSSKAAGLAIDSMVTRAIEKGQAVKESLAGGLLSGLCTDGCQAVMLMLVTSSAC